MVSYRINGPMCTERDSAPSWMDFGTSNRQLSPTPGSCAEETHARAKKNNKHVHPPKPKHKSVPLTAAGFLQEVKVFEGIVPHMYRDSNVQHGYVTVGIGFNIEGSDGKIVPEALKWPFLNSVTGKRATEDEITAEFESVKKQPNLNAKKHAFLASHFKTTLVLDSKYIDQRFEEFRKGFWGQLIKEFGPEFEDKYPMSAQYALLDMIFNLGRGGEHLKTVKKKKVTVRTGLHAYVGLKHAIEQVMKGSGSWTDVGAHSLRHGIGADRNARIREWFEEADKSGAPATTGQR